MGRVGGKRAAGCMCTGAGTQQVAPRGTVGQRLEGGVDSGWRGDPGPFTSPFPLVKWNLPSMASSLPAFGTRESHLRGPVHEWGGAAGKWALEGRGRDFRPRCHPLLPPWATSELEQLWHLGGTQAALVSGGPAGLGRANTYTLRGLLNWCADTPQCWA